MKPSKTILTTAALLGVLLFFAAGCAGSHKEAAVFHGFSMETFRFEGRDAKLVTPVQPAEGRPWIWRARFWGHEPQTDIALLKAGYHLAYLDVSNLYGNTEAVERWNRFYSFLTLEKMLAKHPVLEGMSRGGLIIFNWALANPGLAAAIYADNPVCDIRSWPGGKGTGKGSDGDWKRALRAYDLKDEETAVTDESPADRAADFARTGIPVIFVCGDSDSVVPYEENAKLLYEACREAGSEVELILKPGADHHPHSLKNPDSIVQFLKKWSEQRNSNQTAP